MRILITYILSFAILGFAQAQIAELVQDTREDATFLSNGFQDDCYSVRFGSTKLEESLKSMAVKDLKELLGKELHVDVQSGCKAVASDVSYELKFEYADGTTVVYPTEQMHVLQTAPSAVERLLHDATSVTVKGVSFTNANGTKVKLPDFPIKVK